MNNPTVTRYLQESHLLGTMLSKLDALQRWNQFLSECLSAEKNLSQHCQIVGVDDTTLIILTDSPQWVTRLRFYIPQLIPKLQAYPGLEKIKTIHCKAYPATSNARLQQQPASRRPQGLSAKSAASIREAANQLKDEKLRKVMEKIAARIKTL